MKGIQFLDIFLVTVSQPGSKMVASAKSAVPTVADQAAAMQLGQCAKNLATCLAELRTATQKVPLHSRVIFFFCTDAGGLSLACISVSTIL